MKPKDTMNDESGRVKHDRLKFLGDSWRACFLGLAAVHARDPTECFQVQDRQA